MSEWEEKQIKNLATAFSGYAFAASELVDTGIPVLKIGNIGSNKISTNVDSYYNGAISDKLFKYLLGNNDFLIAMTGAGSVGKVGKMFNKQKEYLVNQRVAIVRNTENANGTFLYYWFTLPFVEKYLYSLGIGAGQPNISAKDILNIKLSVPDLPTQKRIADILSAYDDLIENNNKRIALLEKAAEELYKEWFVRFRFPGHETAEFENGIPKGWRKAKLYDLAIEVDNAEKAENRGNFEHYLPIDRLPSKSMVLQEEDSIDNAASSLVSFKKNDILFGAMRPYFHKVIIAPYDGLTRTTCFVLNSIEKMYRWYLYLLLFQKETIDYATTVSVGSTMPYDRWKDLARMSVVIPEVSIIEKFNCIIKPLLARIIGSYAINSNLIKQRDMLLPRLMSGKLEVRH